MNLALLAHLTPHPHLHDSDGLALIVVLMVSATLWAVFRRAR